MYFIFFITYALPLISPMSRTISWIPFPMKFKFCYVTILFSFVLMYLIAFCVWTGMDRPFLWLFKSSQDGQLSTVSVNDGLIVQVKTASSARLHPAQYGWSTHLGYTRLVRMSCTLVHARLYRKQTTNRKLWITTQLALNDQRKAH